MKILRISMTDLTWSEEELKSEYAALGGRALTSRIVFDEVIGTAHPLGSNNKLVFANGVLTGSLASSAERVSVGAKSPLTGGIKESNSGGTAGLKQGRLGYRAIVVEGIRDDMQIVHISKDGVRFESADWILGKPLSEAANLLDEKFGKHISYYMIGSSGEHKMNLAGIAVKDKDGSPTRFLGRGGLGAVAGSKGVKAIVLDDAGIDRLRPKQPEQFRAAVKRYTEWLQENPATGKSFPDYGTAGLVRTTNRLGALPTFNFRTGSFDKHEAISGETLRETILERGGAGTPTHACMPGCIIRCSNIYPDEAGNKITTPIEYENIGLLGSNLGIGSLDEIAELNRLCNEYGVDTIETGGAIGVLMEAGVLPFGDVEGAIQLLHDVHAGRPMGRIIGGGAALVGKLYGVYRVPVVKGQSMPAYDPRAIKGLGVTYATSPMGADHTAGQTIRAQIDHHKAEGQVEVSRNAQETVIIFDSLGMCYFGASAVAGRWDGLAEIISAYVGEAVTGDEIMQMAKETLTIEHAFNRSAGFTHVDDRLPEHFYTETNPASGTVFDVNEMEVLSIGVEGYR
ncbi:aldehyde ferredoxin oxidoreductase C-terminal domain-containing protein [Effusibacillus dendaii]|uniref:Aldehyde ferredoxin oxidoreductase n=1 Tax=Effusibacillus dendaii TaxID=2743772 RepID=A0A7I8D5Q7_9BACL|nr:aldehyde ferredoxin oxidoreductase C-terminal domain-containing protein [Effusibacillus dendaii]BCJ85488.1 aldehyde ferredoxin oxidoreductase [Effusibacillus dendaii]